ncbi:MAG: hypothetical protein IH623_19200 [Verrucomicrobia bacterium]|nr:hypothetical protein [Verrucomicrobiota bacterium]
MRPTRYNEPPPRPDTEAKRVAAFERKQKWKEQPGNRYTASELREMGDRLGTLTITEAEPDIMRLD